MPFLMPDISHYQGTHPLNDFVEAKGAGADAIMFKATEGTNYTDPEFHNNVLGAEAVGLPWGAYHFVQQDFGASQAAFLCQTAKRATFLVMDWEAGDRATAQAFVQSLKINAPPGIKLGGYFGEHARANGGPVAGFDFAMVPDYGPSSLPSQYNPDPYPLAAWQYTDGKFNGTTMPTRIAGLGGGDISVVYLPDLLGLGDDMAVADMRAGSQAYRAGQPLPANANPDFIFGYKMEGRIDNAGNTPAPVPGPKGDAGPAGPAGPQGPKGDSAILQPGHTLTVN